MGRSNNPLLVGARSPTLGERDPSDALGLVREEVEVAAEASRTRLRDLQARLAAEARRSLLLVLQGLDASGKDGTVRRVFSGVNPMGCQVVSFKAPSHLELAHDYLWRVEAVCPARGEIAIFNRSHYEDVVTTRVLGLIDEATQVRRFDEIRAFEARLVAEGTAIVKVFLHVSKEEQRRRLQARVDDPTKRWKFKLSDLEARARWDDDHEHYEAALRATSTDHAPWYVVPADHKWVRDHIVVGLVLDALGVLDPRYPEAEGFDPSTMRVE